MQRQDKLIMHFLEKAFEHIPDDGKQTGKQIKFASCLVILILLCLFLTGSEAVKVTLRKRTGECEISYIRLFLTTVFILLTGILFINNGSEIYNYMFSHKVSKGNNQSFIIGGVFYIGFGAFLAVLGVLNKLKAQQLDLPDMYPGRCRLFEKIESKSALRRSAIRNLWHPCIFLTGGGIIFYFNSLLGLPIMICGISYLIVFAVEFTAGFESERMAAISEYDGMKKFFDNKQPPDNRLSDRPGNAASIADKW